MMEHSYRRHRFPSVVIQHAVRVYLRFTLSYRDVEDLSTAVGGDFFEAVPAADLYLLRYILHDWDDAACIRILQPLAARPVRRLGCEIDILRQ